MQYLIHFFIFLAPSAPAGNLTQVNSTATSATIKWAPSSPYAWNGRLEQYVVEYQLVKSVDQIESSGIVEPLLELVIPSPGRVLANEQDPTIVAFPLRTETAFLNGLEEYHIYAVSVYFENRAGQSPSTTSIMIETMPSGKNGVTHVAS